MSTTCIIFNPVARGDKARDLFDHLKRRCDGIVLKPTQAQGHARSLAKEAVEEGFTTVVAAGGDGTINEVVNGLLDAEDGFVKTRLAVLPIGTINVFARELGIPMKWRDAWDLLQGNREIEIDVPSVEFAGPQGIQNRAFVQLAGTGWDARAVELVDWELKKKIGFFAYVLSGFKALGEPAASITVRTSKDVATGNLVVIGNGRYYAGSYPVFHRANLSDGLLDICVFEECRWSCVPRYTLKFLMNQMFKPGAYTYFQAAEATLSTETSAGLQLEGELVGRLPARFYINPKKLRVVVG